MTASLLKGMCSIYIVPVVEDKRWLLNVSIIKRKKVGLYLANKKHFEFPKNTKIPQSIVKYSTRGSYLAKGTRYVPSCRNKEFKTY